MIFDPVRHLGWT